jgi:hypothetical protein
VAGTRKAAWNDSVDAKTTPNNARHYHATNCQKASIKPVAAPTISGSAVSVIIAASNGVQENI